MKYLLLVAILLTVLAYFTVLYTSVVKKQHFKNVWVEVSVNVYLVFMILSLSIVLRYIF